MNRTTIKLAIGITVAALLALLGYSLERTAWLFERFETEPALAYAAAVVVELAAVALIAGAGAIALLDKDARAWANRALVAVLSVQSLANLSAGYLRGGRATLTLFGTADDLAAYAVAASLWFVTNMAVPALVLCLSKLLERLIAALGALPAEPPKDSVSLPIDGELPDFSIAPQLVELDPREPGFFNSQPETPALYACKKCGAGGFTFGELGRHSRACQGLVVVEG